MINEALYKRTTDILYEAYFNDTLAHGNQCGCAVGNIIAANMGITVKKDEDGNPYWFTPRDAVQSAKWFGAISKDWANEYPNEEIDFQIKSSGYSTLEIFQIEIAFEAAPFGNSKEDYMFNGLSAVLEVLNDIHQVDTLPAAETKHRFTSHYQSLQNA